MSGWFPDPAGRHEFRYHNGRSWTADVSDAGQRYVDPILATTPPSSGPRNRLAVASLVLGVASIGLAFIPFVFVLGLLAGVLAVVFGVIGLRRARSGGDQRPFAVAGLVTGATGCAAAAVGFVLTVALIDAVDRFENPGAHEVTVTSCESEREAWVAVGAVRNLDDATRSYLVTLEFVRAGTDNAQASARVSLDDVPAGESATFEVRRAVPTDEVECAITRVDGPAPFGIDIGR